MEMPSVLKMARTAMAEMKNVASLRRTLLTVAARRFDFQIVGVRGGELLQPGDQPAGDEHQS